MDEYRLWKTHDRPTEAAMTKAAWKQSDSHLHGKRGLADTAERADGVELEDVIYVGRQWR